MIDWFRKHAGESLLLIAIVLRYGFADAHKYVMAIHAISKELKNKDILYITFNFK